jgi:uncharacterized protein with GYD domain
VWNYILLLTLTPAGRERMLVEPASLMDAAEGVSVPGVEMLGLYGVLGEYDFVSIVEAPDNETMARFSLEFGVRAGAQIETLPAIPITRFEGALRDPSVSAAASLTDEPEVVQR